MKACFKGIRRTPSNAEEGELDYAMDLMPWNGELKLIPQMERLPLVLQDGERLMCVHRMDLGGNATKYYIVKNDGVLAAYDSQGVRIEIASFDAEVDDVAVMGNMLVVRSGTTGGYVIWKDGNYHFLGSALPAVDMRFQLRNHFVQTFDKGNDTGITLQPSSSSHAADFSTIIPPTPMTVEFRGEHDFQINVQLQESTSYRLLMQKISASTKVGMSVWLIDDADRLRYVGYDRGKSPSCTFATKAGERVTAIRCVVSGYADMHYSYSAVVLKGETSESGLIFSNTEENFNALMGVANKFVNHYARKENKFIYPFFVRYALRLYDGSYVCPSAPCLMLPNVGCVPRIWTFGNSGGGVCDTYTSANISELRYKLLDIEGLARWEGIVTGIAIAVSSPVYSFDQGAEWTARKPMVTVEKAVEGDDNGYMGYGQFDDGNGGYSSDYLFRTYNQVDTSQDVFTIRLPEPGAEKLTESLQGKGLFYIIKEIDIDELPSNDGWRTVDMADDTLTALECKRRLDDNVMSLSQRWGRTMMAYNSRLVVGDMAEHLFPGYMPAAMNGTAGNMRDGVAEGMPAEWIKALVSCEVDGKSYTVCVKDTGMSNDAPFCWFAYPGLNAQAAVVWRKLVDGTYQRAAISLRRHDMLNLSYWFDHFNTLQWTDPISAADLTEIQLQEVEAATGGPVVFSHNKIQQTEVNNPFLFSPTLTNKVGTTDIRAMTVATHALSQGQFGQFPLYVFTGDGIWALTIDDDGTFATKQPVSRDVCGDSRSMVMTDHAVAFITGQGLKVLTGSAISTLSEKMEGWVADLSPLRTIDMDFDSLIVDEPQGFTKGLENATMAYDYPNNLLHIYPADADFHYVYGIDSGEFALSHIPAPVGVINDYPDTLIQTDDGIYRFAVDISLGQRRAIALTRPFCFDDPVATKHLNDLRVVWHRHSPDSSVRIAVLASNDRLTWWRMPSLNSHSYRWFRIAIFANITPLERIENIEIT